MKKCVMCKKEKIDTDISFLVGQNFCERCWFLFEIVGQMKVEIWNLEKIYKKEDKDPFKNLFKLVLELEKKISNDK